MALMKTNSNIAMPKLLINNLTYTYIARYITGAFSVFHLNIYRVRIVYNKKKTTVYVSKIFSKIGATIDTIPAKTLLLVSVI